METTKTKRKLTAILSADVKGYSRLMGEDEKATVATLKKYRDIISSLVEKHSGRVVDSPGDNLLAEFGSVVDAVECAVTIQKILKDENASLPEDRRMEFRIGVNLGDVIEDEKRIYGDGVNVAARVEGLAEGGGICISGTAFDQVKNKLKLGYEYLGEHAVKNIAEPVRVYKVLTEPEYTGKVIGELKPKTKQLRGVAIGAVAILIIVAGIFAIWNFYLRPDVEPASVEKMAYPLPEKPSIAVLPFVNMSGDPKQEFFSDGMTEEIITGLSKSPYLFVIARQSTFAYKGKPVKVKQVSEELGVRYVLEGSVRRSGKKVRITAQFIDALTGHHLWAERYDRDLKDIFALQDEITMKIMTALHVKLEVGDQARLLQRGARNLEAFLKAMEGREHIYRYNKEDNAMAKKLFKEVIALDPDWAMGYWGLSRTLFWDVYLGTSKSPKESMAKAFELLKKANAMDESNASVHVGLGVLLAQIRQYDKAVSHVEQALALEPNLPEVLHHAASTLCFAGRPEEAIGLINKAMRLDPVSQAQYFIILSLAHRMTGRYDEAMKQAKRAVERDPKNQFGYITLAGASILAGHEEEARAASEQVLKINPKFTLEKYARTLKYKDQSQVKLYIEALRKAGLPDKPPLPLPDKPSIAVLPFTNMSEDPKQEYFSDGMSEEIITALSKTPKLFVIARNSTFTYKNKPTKVQQVGRELGVKYVLEGSVRKAGDKVRVTAQLVDAKTGNHLWAERYDRDLKDIFVVQDEITMKIITLLRVRLTEGEMSRTQASGTNNLDAYLLFLQGQEEARRMNKDGNFLSQQLARQAIALDSKYAMAYNLLASSTVDMVYLGLSEDPRLSLKKAMELAQKAIALDNSLALPHALLGWIYILMRQHDKGIAECEQAVNLEPNSALAHFRFSLALRYAGRPKEAITMCKEAIRLDPIPVSLYYQSLTNAYCLTGEHEEAIAAGKKATSLGPNNLVAHAFLAAAYALHGREEEARVEAAEVLRINPKFSVEYWAKTMPYKNKADRDLTINALRNAGLK
jgi:adenylate cyclase